MIYMSAKRNEIQAMALDSMLQTFYKSRVINWTSRIDQDLERARNINQGIVMIEDLAALDRHENGESQECDGP